MNTVCVSAGLSYTAFIITAVQKVEQLQCGPQANFSLLFQRRTLKQCCGYRNKVDQVGFRVNAWEGGKCIRKQ